MAFTQINTCELGERENIADFGRLQFVRTFPNGTSLWHLSGGRMPWPVTENWDRHLRKSLPDPPIFPQVHRHLLCYPKLVTRADLVYRLLQSSFAPISEWQGFVLTKAHTEEGARSPLDVREIWVHHSRLHAPGQATYHFSLLTLSEFDTTGTDQTHPLSELRGCSCCVDPRRITCGNHRPRNLREREKRVKI